VDGKGELSAMSGGTMTRTELLTGSATFLAVLVAGVLSSTWVDRHYSGAAQVPSASASACVSEDGSWKNWIWANVPMLSPKCPPDK
jgi:hypothetical protein